MKYYKQLKIFYSILITATLVLNACNNTHKEKGADEKVYQQAKETLLEKEKKNPADFLKIISHDKHNILGQTVIKASINSLAKVCVFTDVLIEISFISKTGTLLEKDNETIYETIEPGKSVDFKTKYFAPKGTGSIDIKVLGAKTK